MYVMQIFMLSCSSSKILDEYSPQLHELLDIKALYPYLCKYNLTRNQKQVLMSLLSLRMRK